VGPRSDGQPSQSYPGEETAKDDRYPNSQRISNNILRVGDSAGGVPTPQFELRALELCRVYEHMRAPPSTAALSPDGLSASNVREEAKLKIWE
jgi:hypothetical protein